MRATCSRVVVVISDSNDSTNYAEQNYAWYTNVSSDWTGVTVQAENLPPPIGH